MSVKKFEVLNAFRGVAALQIAVIHLALADPLIDNGRMPNTSLMVDFFFVLSGFVLTHVYLSRWRHSLASFALGRLGRLYPLYLYTLLVMLLCELLKYYVNSSGFIPLVSEPFSYNNGTTFVENLLMFNSFPLMGREITWNYPSWSTAAGFYTNILVAGLVVLFAVRTQGRLLVFAVALYCAAYTTLVLLDASLKNTGDFGFFRCVYDFSIGIMAFFVQKKTETWAMPKSLATVLEGVSLVSLFWAVAAFKNGANLFMPLLFVLMIAVFTQEAGWISKLLRRRVFAYLGKISYSIYLNHAVLAVLFSKAFTLIFPQGGEVLLASTTVLYLAVVVFYSHFTYKLIEEPARVKIKAWAARLAPSSGPGDSQSSGGQPKGLPAE